MCTYVCMYIFKWFVSVIMCNMIIINSWNRNMDMSSKFLDKVGKDIGL